jgi:hypothetical protein
MAAEPRRLWQQSPEGPVRRAEPVSRAPEGTPPNAPVAVPPRFWRAVRRAVREAYDALGTVLALSSLMAAAAFLVVPGTAASVLALRGPRGLALAHALWRGEAAPAGPRMAGETRVLWFAFVVAVIVGWTLLGPLLAGIYRYVRLIVAREDPAPADLFREARRLARSGMALAAAQAVVGQILLVDLLFFVSLPVPVLRWVGMLFFYPLLFWGLMIQYQWPLLAEIVEERSPSVSRPLTAVLTAVKKSALLALDNLAFSLGLWVCGLLWTLVCGVTAIGAVLLWAGSLAFLHTVALRELLRKYGILLPEPAPEDAIDTGYGWHE